MALFQASTFVAVPGIIRAEHLDPMVVSTTSGQAPEWGAEEIGIHHVAPWL